MSAVRLKQTVRIAGKWFVEGYSLLSDGSRVGFVLKGESNDQVMQRVKSMQETINSIHPRGNNGSKN